MRSIGQHNRVAAFQVLQVLRLATLKTPATEYDKNTSKAGKNRDKLHNSTEHRPSRETNRFSVNKLPAF
jgi:hypothetical protein